MSEIKRGMSRSGKIHFVVEDEEGERRARCNRRIVNLVVFYRSSRPITCDRCLQILSKESREQ